VGGVNAIRVIEPFKLPVLAVFLLVSLFPSLANATTTERVSVDSAGNQANGRSTMPAISANGRCFVVFESAASNLVSGDTNGAVDVFVHDHVKGTNWMRNKGLVGTPVGGQERSPSSGDAVGDGGVVFAAS
jgi:hypothetical protein